MSEYTQNQNNPSGIWQHIWVTLIMQAISQYEQKNYLGTYTNLKLLNSQLPPECKEDVKKSFEEIENIIRNRV